MAEIPELSEASVERWVGEASYGRGWGYFRDGHILNPRRQGRDNYTMAAAYLVRLRELYRRLGELSTWETLIIDLRERNRRLRALKEELQKAGL